MNIAWLEQKHTNDRQSLKSSQLFLEDWLTLLSRRYNVQKVQIEDLSDRDVEQRVRTIHQVDLNSFDIVLTSALQDTVELECVLNNITSPKLYVNWETSCWFNEKQLKYSELCKSTLVRVIPANLSLLKARRYRLEPDLWYKPDDLPTKWTSKRNIDICDIHLLKNTLARKDDLIVEYNQDKALDRESISSIYSMSKLSLNKSRTDVDLTTSLLDSLRQGCVPILNYSAKKLKFFNKELANYECCMFVDDTDLDFSKIESLLKEPQYKPMLDKRLKNAQWFSDNILGNKLGYINNISNFLKKVIQEYSE